MNNGEPASNIKCPEQPTFSLFGKPADEQISQIELNSNHLTLLLSSEIVRIIQYFVNNIFRQIQYILLIFFLFGIWKPKYSRISVETESIHCASKFIFLFIPIDDIKVFYMDNGMK